MAQKTKAPAAATVSASKTATKDTPTIPHPPQRPFIQIDWDGDLSVRPQIRPGDTPAFTVTDKTGEVVFEAEVLPEFTPGVLNYLQERAAAKRSEQGAFHHGQSASQQSDRESPAEAERETYAVLPLRPFAALSDDDLIAALDAAPPHGFAIPVEVPGERALDTPGCPEQMRDLAYDLARNTIRRDLRQELQVFAAQASAVDAWIVLSAFRSARLAFRSDAQQEGSYLAGLLRALGFSGEMIAVGKGVADAEVRP